MRRAYWVAAIVLAIAAVAGWYFASPRWTLGQMKAAAEAGDVDELATYIDFPKLRASMKEELKANAAANMQKGDGFAALGALLATNMMDGLVDGMVTPAMMRKVFVRDKNSGPEGMTKVDATAPSMTIDRKGLDYFFLRDRRKDSGALVFERDGLGWKMIGIRLPQDKAAPSDATATDAAAAPAASGRSDRASIRANTAGQRRSSSSFVYDEAPEEIEAPRSFVPAIDTEEMAADAVTNEVNVRRAQDEGRFEQE